MRFPRAVSVSDLPRPRLEHPTRSSTGARLAWSLGSRRTMRPSFTPTAMIASELHSAEGLVNRAADLSAADPDHFLRRTEYRTQAFVQGRGQDIVFTRASRAIAATDYGFIDEFNVGGGTNIPPELLEREFVPSEDGVLRAEKPEIERVAGLAIPFCHYGYTAFGHFVLDGLLQIHLWEKELLAGEAKLVHWPLQERWMQPAIEACGLPPRAQRTLTKPFALLQQAGLSSALAAYGAYHPASYSRRFFAWLASRFPAPGRAAPEKIYIRRSAGSPRPVHNSQELEALARAYGFMIVDPSEHSFAEQVGLFAGAGTVMSVWGSTLTLAPLVGGRRRVIELLPEQVLDTWFFRQCVVHRLDYFPVLQPTSPDGRFVADLEGAERALQASETS